MQPPPRRPGSVVPAPLCCAQHARLSSRHLRPSGDHGGSTQRLRPARGRRHGECGAVLPGPEGETRAQWPLPPETQSMARTGALEGSRPPVRQSPLTPPLPSLQPIPLNQIFPEGGECSYISLMPQTSQLTHQPCS